MEEDSTSEISPRRSWTESGLCDKCGTGVTISCRTENAGGAADCDIRKYHCFSCGYRGSSASLNTSDYN